MRLRFEGRACDADSGAVEWTAAHCDAGACAGRSWRRTALDGAGRDRLLGRCGVAPEACPELRTHDGRAGATPPEACVAPAPGTARFHPGPVLAVWRRGGGEVRLGGVVVAAGGAVALRGQAQPGREADLFEEEAEEEHGQQGGRAAGAVLAKRDACALLRAPASDAGSTQYELDSVSLVTHPQTMRLVDVGDACGYGTIYDVKTRMCSTCPSGRTANAQASACVCQEGRFVLEGDGPQAACRLPAQLCSDDEQYFKLREGTLEGACVDVPEGFVKDADGRGYGCARGRTLSADGLSCEGGGDATTVVPSAGGEGQQ